MKLRTFGASLALLAAACAPKNGPDSARLPVGSSQSGGDAVIARVDGRAITMEQLRKPLLEAHGLNFLLNLVQLEMVKGRAEKVNLAISRSDIDGETDRTLRMMFADVPVGAERERVLEQFLQQQRLSREEFDLVMTTNAYLRKLAEPIVAGRIGEQTLRDAFNQRYGETVRVRHIQLTNLAEVAEAKRRLDAGEPFEKVAEAMSRNPRTAAVGGELPPFTRDRADLPEAFRQAAFNLKEGEVSDPVQAEGAFHLIKLEKKIAPKAVKFEDVRESVRADLTEALIQATMRQLRSDLVAEAMRTLQIDDPILKKAYDDRLAKQEADLKDRGSVRNELENRRQRMNETPASGPATKPTSGLATEPTSAPATGPATEAAMRSTVPSATESAPVTVGSPAGTGETPGGAASAVPAKNVPSASAAPAASVPAAGVDAPKVPAAPASAPAGGETRPPATRSGG